MSQQSIVPRITTERLVLRAFQRADFDVYAAWLAESTEPPGPVNRRDAWRMFTSSSGHWMLDGTGWWALELAGAKELIGTCGAFHREDHPDRESTVDDLELGWTIRAPFRRHGYATEAAAAALAFGRDHLHAKRIIAHIDPENVASIRVAEGIGLSFARDVRFYDANIPLRLYTKQYS